MYFIMRAKLGELPDQFFGLIGPYSSYTTAKVAKIAFQENDATYIYFLVKQVGKK